MSAEIAERAREAVKLDLEDGMRRWFDTDADGGFAPARHLEQAGSVIADDRFAAVAWEYTGRHARPIAGIATTGRRVTICGVTIIDLSDLDEPRFHRYVDWNGVMAQLGLAVSARPIVAVDPAPDQPQEPVPDGDRT